MELTKEQELTMDIARAGYEAYAAYTGNKSVITGDDLPKWNDLPGGVINAWFCAAESMIRAHANILKKENRL
jgi:hypothetical protein